MYTFDNGKRYIGQTVTRMRDRHYGHKSTASTQVVDKALRIHSYTLEIIDHVPESELDSAETYYINMFNSVTPNGYNISLGGQKVKHPSPEQIARHAEALRGRPLSQAHKDAISRGNTGKVFTEEHCKRISESRIGDKNPNYGKSMPDAIKLKLSIANSKPIVNIDTGEVFGKMGDAIVKYGGDPSQLTKVCKGYSGRKTFKGYHWRYLHDTDTE